MLTLYYTRSPQANSNARLYKCVNSFENRTNEQENMSNVNNTNNCRVMTILQHFVLKTANLKVIGFNHFQDGNTLALSKMKTFTNNKYNVTENIKFVFHGVGNIMGKRR